jgi:hypothetical protein
MRKYLVLSVLGAGLLVLAPGTAAFAGSSATPASPTPTPTPTATPTPTPTPIPTPTIYAGKNSQGQTLRFAVAHTASGPQFEPIFISQILRCPVTGEVIGEGDSFGSGFGVPIRNGQFNFVLNDFGHLLRWSGTVTSTGASGKESIDSASFDKEGGLQDCGAGSLSWTAKAVAPGSPAAAPSAAYVVKFTKAPDGSVVFSVTH